MNEQKDKFHRQKLAFGEEGQWKIASTVVGIVGLGGAGSCVAQMLAYLGVKEFILIDDDRVEETNLNRLIGASAEDVISRTPKVEVAGRVIASINPRAAVTQISKNLRSEEALGALCGKPAVIFGCVDNDSARLILTELCAAYEKTLIDCGTEIIINEGFQEFGGRVIVARPGDFCLLCAGQIDLAVAQQELESEQERSTRDRLGYGLGNAAPNPTVISLNGVIAGIAVTEFLMLVTGLRLPHRRITYKGMRGVLTQSIDTKKDDCVICNYVVGKRQQADIQRYICKGLPKDLPS